jgi:hypothetical protein
MPKTPEEVEAIRSVSAPLCSGERRKWGDELWHLIDELIEFEPEFHEEGGSG